MVNVDDPLIGYDNAVTVDTLSVTSEDTDFPGSNLANVATDLPWKSLVLTAQYLTVTISSTDPVDYMAVARHNFNTAGVAISIEGDSGSGYVELIAAAIPSSDGPQIYRFAPRVLIGLRMKLAVSPSILPQAAVLYAGKLLVLQRRIYVNHTPIPYGRRTNVTNGRSEGGEYLGRIVLSSFLDTSVDMENLTPDWYRTYMDPFIESAKESPFFFSWRPGAYPTECGFAWLTADAQPQNTRSNGMMSITLQMSGIA